MHAKIDPLLAAIHPPCVYAGGVASAMGVGLCRSKMMNGIVALYSSMQKGSTYRLSPKGKGFMIYIGW